MNTKLNEMTIAQLVDRIIAIALDQHEAMLDFDNAKFNRLYDERKNVEEKGRGALVIKGAPCFHCSTIPMPRFG